MRLYHVVSVREASRVTAGGFPADCIAFRFTSARPEPPPGFQVVEIEVGKRAPGVEEIAPGVYFVQSFAANSGRAKCPVN